MYRFIFVVIFLALLSGTVTGASYVHGNGQTVAKVNESGIYYIHSDNIGSRSAITNEAGEPIAEQNYLPFGEEFNPDPDARFTGKEFDSDLNSYYFGARHYSPSTGRFLNSDPAQDGMNWYAYAINNPLKYIDPLGLKAVYVEKVEANAHEVTYTELKKKYQDLEFDDPNIAAIITVYSALRNRDNAIISKPVLKEFLSDTGSKFRSRVLSVEKYMVEETDLKTFKSEYRDTIQIRFSEAFKFEYKWRLPIIGRCPLIGRLLPSAKVEVKFPEEVEIHVLKQDENLDVYHIVNGDVPVKFSSVLRWWYDLRDFNLEYWGVVRKNGGAYSSFVDIWPYVLYSYLSEEGIDEGSNEKALSIFRDVTSSHRISRQ